MRKSKRTAFEMLENRMMLSVAEPNNNLGKAVLVDGFGGFGGVASFSDTISPTDTLDCYKINAPMSFYQNFTARLKGLTGDLTLSLIHDLNGDQVETSNEFTAKSAHPGTSDESVSSTLIPQLGAYYLIVSPGASGVTSNYTLEINNDTAPDEPSKARAIFSNGAGSVSDAIGLDDRFDVYRVLFNGRSNTATFAARLTAGNAGNYHVDLYEDKNRNSTLDSGELITSSRPNSGGQEIGLQDLDANKSYYIRVLNSAAGAMENYVLHTQMDYAGNTEPKATFLGGPEGRIVAWLDQAGLDTTTSFSDPVDYFKFVVSNTGFVAVSQLRVAKDFFPGTSHLTQELFRDANKNGKVDPGELMGSATTDSSTGISELKKDTPPGTYFVRISGSPAPNYEYYLSLDGVPGITAANPSFSKSLDVGTLTRQVSFDDGLGAGDASDTYKFKLAQAGAVDFRLEEQFSQEQSPVSATIAVDTNGNGKRDAGETIGTFDLKNPLLKTLGKETYYVTLSGGFHYGLGLILTPDFAGNSTQKAKDLGTLGSFASASDMLLPDPNGDVDFYKFKLASNQKVTVNVVGSDSLATVTVTLFKDNGNGTSTQVSQVTGAPGGKAFLQKDLAAGTYYTKLSVTGISLFYTVGFSAGDNDDSIPETDVNPGNQLFTNGFKDFTITDKSDVDMIRFFTAPGHTIEIDVDSRSGSTLNSYLRLFDASGKQIANNDDGKAPGETASKFSYLKFKIPSSSAGFVSVYAAVSSASNKNYDPKTGGGDAGGGSTGAYRVTITDLSGPVEARVVSSPFSKTPVRTDDDLVGVLVS
jgi:hypothetical protein